MICPFRATPALFSTSSHWPTQAKLFMFSIYLVLIYSIKLFFITSHNYKFVVLHAWWCHVLAVHPHQKMLFCEAREYFTIKFRNNSLNHTVTGGQRGTDGAPGPNKGLVQLHSSEFLMPNSIQISAILILTTISSSLCHSLYPPVCFMFFCDTVWKHVFLIKNIQIEKVRQPDRQTDRQTDS